MKRLPEHLEKVIWNLQDKAFAQQMKHKNLKAIDLYKDAIKYLPMPIGQWIDTPVIWQNIAENYLLLKKYNEALEYYSNIMSLPNSVGKARYHLTIGQIHFELGDMKKAKDELLRAYAIDGLAAFKSVDDPKYFALIKPVMEGKKSYTLSILNHKNQTMSAQAIDELLKQIEGIYAVIAPSYLPRRRFQSGKASEAEIKDFETELGEALPTEFRHYLLTNEFGISCASNFSLMPIDEIKLRWNMMKKLVEKENYNANLENYESNFEAGEIKRLLWNTKWVPFALDGGGNMKCIDLDPGPQGQLGQIIGSEVHEGPFVEEYSSFTNYLEKQLKYLQHKQYELEEYDGEVDVLIDNYKKPE